MGVPSNPLRVLSHNQPRLSPSGPLLARGALEQLLAADTGFSGADPLTLGLTGSGTFDPIAGATGAAAIVMSPPPDSLGFEDEGSGVLKYVAPVGPARFLITGGLSVQIGQSGNAGFAIKLAIRITRAAGPIETLSDREAGIVDVAVSGRVHVTCRAVRLLEPGDKVELVVADQSSPSTSPDSILILAVQLTLSN